MSLDLALAFIVSLGVTVAVGLVLIPALRRIKAGQTISSDGPVWHNKKQGTPIMGGVMFIAGIAVSCLTVGFGEIREGGLSHIFVLAFALIFAAIGFLDDYEKLKKKQNLGLTVRQKFLLQLVVAVAFVLLMRLTGNLTTNLYSPCANTIVPVPEPLYYAFAAFVVVGTVNSVNITDGVDGLATGVSIPIAVFYVSVAFLWGYTALGIFSAALAGGLVGFLIFNFPPARVFLGGPGSLFLGGAVCAMAFAMDMPLILIPLGIVYFIETLSDIIQVTYFKLTKGKRVFKMAPLHHHFEMCGWSEYKLFAVFTTVSALFAALSYYGVFYRCAA
jgi:phospho-N-acetylmuramoyl-pentapeptide-transferase